MIEYRSGDATDPSIKKGTRVIAHICNDAGKWGAGFSAHVSDRWKEPEEFYRRQFRFAKSRFKLGEVQWVFVGLHVSVVNMVAQAGVRGGLNRKPIRYESLESCLSKLAVGCASLLADPCTKGVVTIHMPRIGCGLAGGTWEKVGPLVGEILWDIPVYVYDLVR